MLRVAATSIRFDRRWTVTEAIRNCSVIAFGKALARETATKGVTVNNACPGPLSVSGGLTMA